MTAVPVRIADLSAKALVADTASSVAVGDASVNPPVSLPKRTSNVPISASWPGLFQDSCLFTFTHVCGFHSFLHSFLFRKSPFPGHDPFCWVPGIVPSGLKCLSGWQAIWRTPAGRSQRCWGHKVYLSNSRNTHLMAAIYMDHNCPGLYRIIICRWSDENKIQFYQWSMHIELYSWQILAWIWGVHAGCSNAILNLTDII